ncbi:MAG: GC-type dockerin domain-anchored protein, partial [Planctomycetota bacterium]|nr:GC-type dockerin domain-anchored protein [Planctomycetota bacterium]
AKLLGDAIEASVCPADFNADGVANTLDVVAFLNAWAAGDGAADIDGNGTVDTRDVLVFLNLWNEGC